MKFGLKEGMDKKAIIAEMWGRTSGETRGQVLQVLMPREERKIGAKAKQFTIDMLRQYVILRNRKNCAFGRWLSVIKANDKYALIQETKAHATLKTQRNGGNHIISSDDYYLAGISDDEEKYFLHKLKAEGTREVARKTENLDALVDFVDRKNEGFERRIQGDLLLQFVPIKGTQRRQMMFNGAWTTLGQYYILQDEIERPCRFYQVPPTNIPLQLSIGRHVITVLGELAFQSRPARGYHVFGGQAITIAHPEHRTVHVKIPDDQLAVIGVQRGPDIRMSEAD